MVFLLIVALGLGMMVLAVALVAWVAFRGPGQRAGTSEGGGSRSQLIEMAARAASDEQGPAIFALLAELEGAPAGGPVAVKWWPHRPADGRPSGLMLTLSWDGNEWRRVLVPEQCLEAFTQAAQSSPPSAQGQRLLADLQGAAGR